MNQMINTVKMLSVQLNKNRSNRKIMNKMISKIEQIKCVKDDKIFLESFKEIMTSKNYFFPNIRENIEKNLFPNTPKYIDVGPELKISKDFYTELRWMVFLFAIYSKELSIFIQNRKKFDKYILLGEYEKALKILETIETEYGVSFWLLENKLFIYNKLGKNISVIFDDWPEDANKVIVSYYELKMQENRTYGEYQYFVDKEIAALKGLESERPFLKDIIPYYNYRIASLTYELTETNIFSVLKGVASNPLIDRYLLCLKIFEFALTAKADNRLYLSVKKCIGMLENLRDEQLEALRFCFDTEDNRKNYRLKKKLELAKSAFICGNLEECREKSITILKKTPFNVQALNLLVETDILLDITEETEFAGTILGELINLLIVVYPMREERNEKINDVYKLLISCSQSTWAPMVANTITNRCRLVNTKEEIATKKIECIQYLDIDTVCNCLMEKDAIEFINQIKINNEYIDLRTAILTGDFERANNSCSLEDLKHLLAVRNPLNDMQEKRKHVEAVKGSGSTFELLISKHYFIQLDWEEEFYTIFEFAVDLMIDNISTSLFIPINQLISHIENMDSEISSNICVPILYYIKYRYFSREIKSQVCAACEDFLYFAKIGLPSQMENYDESLGVKRVIFFLRHVCTTEILSTALASVISNSIDLAQERLNVCLILCKKDPDNEKIYEQEIRDITQKKKINSELRIIEENRIHVNVEGMRQDLIDNYKNDFARVQLYKDTSFKELLEAIDAVKENKPVVVFYQSDAGRVMRELIRNIRDAFVSSNEYGLDGYLSLNIRHGAISDALRSPLSAAGLLTVYNSKKKEYELNAMWNDNVGNSADDKLIYQAIEKFTKDTDVIIDDLRTKYIRINTEKVETEGIFNYIITDEEHNEILNRSSSFENIDGFLNYAFDFLWEKTESNLIEMKALLKGEIQKRYEESFLTLKNTIECVKNKNKTAGMLRKIVEASNDMPNVINKVCFWFQRSTESKHTDFDLDFVFNMVLETVTNMHPDTSFKPVKIEDFDVNGKIDGKYLKLYSDIFYNLMDNIYKKAIRNVRNQVNVEYILKQTKNTQYIYLQNDYDCSANKKEDEEKLNKLRIILESEEYLKRVKGEGGTGIPKICKIIRVDLQKKGSINFGLKEKENKFFIEISMQKRDIV